MIVLAKILVFFVGILLILFLFFGLAGDNFDLALLALMFVCLLVQFFDTRALFVFAGAVFLIVLLDYLSPGTRGGMH